MFLLKTISLLGLAASGLAATLTVNPGTTYQTIDGFGGMNGWTTMPNADVKTAYSPDGLNFNILRVRLSDNQNEWASIAAMVKYAYSVNPNIKVWAAVWAPPASMLDKVNVPSSCHIKQVLAASSYGAYATYLNSFVTYMKNNGAPLYALSMQNEPDWDWTCWTPEMMVAWLKQYRSQVTGVKMIAPEPLGYSSKYINAVLGDSASAAAVDIVGGHLYGANPYSFDSKGKPIWMTEHLLNENVGWTETMTMAREINSVFTSGWNAYMWWYIRRYYSFIGDGEQGTTSGAVLPRGWVFSLWSKNVLPGYKRVAVSDSGSGYATSAYAGGNKVVVMVTNSGSSAASHTIVPGKSFTGVTASFVSQANQKVFTVSPTSQSATGITINVPASAVGAIVFTVGSGPATTTTTSGPVITTTTSRPATTTTTVRTTTTTVAAGNCAAKWGQCGGQGWTGPKCCVSGSTCTFSNDWYSQCL